MLLRSLVSAPGILLLLAACTALGNKGNGGRDVPAAELRKMGDVANAFWSAATRSDSGQVATLSVSTKAAEWATGKRAAFPLFFEQTDHRLELKHGYFLRAPGDTAIIEVEVPFQTCRPPYHTGDNDRYFLMMVPALGEWRIASIWSDPC
jgi:hypothetical protein